ncbi:MAG: hypothetical protein ACK50L_02530 [Bacteroidota bacterium]
MPTLRSHTHLQAPQASTQPKLTNKYAYPTARTENKALVVTAPKKNDGGSANINSCAFNKHGAFRQFSIPKPPLLLAANRYASP